MDTNVEQNESTETYTNFFRHPVCKIKLEI
nr:MAG TPA: hypothetical protein [Caudoviricetes sp.]